MPKFGGNLTDNYDDWIFLVDSYQRFNNIKNDQMMGLILPLVRGQALQILKRMLLKEGEVNWLDYKQELKETYQTDTKARKLRKEFRQLKQGNDFDSFLSKFRTLTNQLIDMDEKEVLDMFVDALKPKAKFEVISRNITDIQEAMRVARLFEECHSTEKKNELKTVNFVEKKGNKEKFERKFEKKERKEEKKVDNNSNIKKKDERSKIKCFECGKVGHIKKECYRNKAKKVNIVNCDSVQQVNMVLVTELPEITGMVNGTKMKMILDSGASISLISRKCAELNGVNINESKIKIRSATDTVEDVVGETDELVVEVKGTICKEKFVVGESSNDVILGQTWFRKTNILFRPADGKIIRENDVKIEDDEIVEVYVCEVENDDESDTEWELDDDEFKKIEVKPEIKLNQYHMTKFTKVMEKVSKLFALSLADLKACNVMEHVIRVEPGPPKYVPPYRKSVKENEIMVEEVKKLLDLDIIEKSSSPWNSPAIVIPKKDGTRRFVIDFRVVNKCIINEIWPMPRIDDIFDRLSGSRIFSTIDITQGYHQILLEEKSRDFTAFSTKTAHYRLIMHHILGHLSFVEVYLDDITIHSKNIEEHLSPQKSNGTNKRKTNATILRYM